jgi:hypothetical protein
MSQDVYTPTGRKLVIVAWVALPLLALALFLYVTLGKSGPVDRPTTPEGSGPEEDALAGARALLGKRTDLASCRQAVQQLNEHLARAPEQRPARLSAGRARALGKEFGLGEDELAEVNSTSFTALDAHHLHGRFLMNDAVEGLELRPAEGGGGKSVPQSGLEQAEAAFGWVVRQVRLQEDPEPVPPAYALLRGWGSPLERALIFLSLLEQFGAEDEGPPALQGCLLFLPGKEKGSPARFWACGVAVGKKPESLYLFDPRLGLPLPGPRGKGVATLAQALTDPDVLGQLNLDRKHSYDVTAGEARSARAYLFCPLSALAPRMALLQDRLLRDRRWKDQPLPAPVQVRLAVDPARARARLASAVGGSGEVGVWREGVGLLRHFVPKEEGGSGKGREPTPEEVKGFLGVPWAGLPKQSRFQLYHVQLAPWEAFPKEFRNPGTFRWDIGLGKELRDQFGVPFIRLYTGPGGPRDLLLRGRYVKAATDLSPEKSKADNWRGLRAAAEDPKEKEALHEWLDRALHVHAELLRAKDPAAKQAAERERAALWDVERGGARPVLTVLWGAMAEDYDAAVSYQLGLCKHEEAQRKQARLDLLVRAGADVRASERKRVRDAWEDPEHMWKEFTANHPDHPAAGAARRLLGEAQARRGERREALASWRDPSGRLTELERLANLIRARRLEGEGRGAGE